MKAIFDRRGFLTPPSPLEGELRFLEEIFVEDMPDVDTRRKLFKGYLSFLNNLKSAINAPFEQWINESFISKKRIPQDIDVVSFIDHEIVDASSQIFKNLSGDTSLAIYGVDSNIVKLYPETHNHHIFTESDRLYWYHLFTNTARNSRGKRYHKGFIKIVFKP